MKLMLKILLVFLLTAGCVFAAGCMGSPQPAEEEVPWTLTLVGFDGIQKNLSVSEVRALPSQSGNGYGVSTVGIKYGPYKIKGVALRDLLREVGGVAPNQTVHVSAADGYLWVFSYEQLQGEDLLCLDLNLKEMKEPVQMLPILMYEADGKPYPYDDGGPFRVATMTERPDVITEGSLWVKWVDRIEVH